MPAIVAMPKLGMTMTEGTVGNWLLPEGQQVEKGTPVLAIETEKIVYEIEAPISGILHITQEQGSVIPCGGECGLMAASQDEYRAMVGGGAIAAPVAGPVAEPVAAADGQAPASATVAEGERIKASPSAKRVARELGVDISLVPGSGPEGRIVEDDIRKFAEAQKAAPTPEPERVAISPVARKLAEDHGLNLSGIQGSGPGGRIVREDIMAAIERQTAPAPTPTPPAPEAPAAGAIELHRVAKTIPLVGMRKAIGDHMMKSLHNMAQLSCTTEVDATDLVNLRQQLVAEADRVGARIAFNDLIIRAIIKALKEFPIFNSSIAGNEIKVYENVNMGVAMAMEDGLIVPVVHDADKLSVVELSKAVSALIDKVRNRTLGFDDVTGGTFTLTNLGQYGIDAFTPIINAPESAILGAGTIVERPAVANGQIVIRSKMILSLTFDHRVVDGTPAAQFLQTIRRLLEHPSVLLV